MSLDVSGNWDGIFNYPRLLPSTGFRCDLRENDGSLTGETQEPQLNGADLTALIEGRRDGNAIHFRKRYDDIDRQEYAVDYEGTLSADGLEITGRWTIRGQWSGTFIMVRLTPAHVEYVREVSQTVQ